MLHKIVKVEGWNLLDENDLPILKEFNANRIGTPKVIKGHLLPEPFIGNPYTANALFLALNPGYDQNDEISHVDPSFRALIFGNLSGWVTDYPYYYLHEHLDLAKYPGHVWCRRIFKSLIERIPARELSQKIACIQYHGYHSISYAKLGHAPLPSQGKTFLLIQQAISRQIPIVLMRSRKIWFGALPELGTYPKLMILKNPRNPTISPGNMQDGEFDALVKELKYS